MLSPLPLLRRMLTACVRVHVRCCRLWSKVTAALRKGAVEEEEATVLPPTHRLTPPPPPAAAAAVALPAFLYNFFVCVFSCMQDHKFVHQFVLEDAQRDGAEERKSEGGDHVPSLFVCHADGSYSFKHPVPGPFKNFPGESLNGPLHKSVGVEPTSIACRRI